ncbi:MAG: Lrp/AsnC family transcriptional regulator [Promethearchaeota archaeon]|nr:MAG: Lrp/AsnC family transcriptional regulator [Candidatus Lokiarchaeota archaeon]
MIDELNKNILKEYQKDANITYRTLAKKIGVPASTIFSRIKQMKDSKVIKEIIPLIDSGAVGKPTTAWIKIALDIDTDCCDFAEEVAKNKKVMEVHEIAGEWDIMLKVKVKDNLALHDLTKEISKTPGIKDMQSIISYKMIKEDPRIAL